MTEMARRLGDEKEQFTVSCLVKPGQDCLQSRGSCASWVISPLITQRRAKHVNSLLFNLLITLHLHLVAEKGTKYAKRKHKPTKWELPRAELKEKSVKKSE